MLIDKNDLSPFGNYESNKQIVRDSVYDPKVCSERNVNTRAIREIICLLFSVKHSTNWR